MPVPYWGGKKGKCDCFQWEAITETIIWDGTQSQMSGIQTECIRKSSDADSRNVKVMNGIGLQDFVLKVTKLVHVTIYSN